MKLKHVISTRQFLDAQILEDLFQLADEMEEHVITKDRIPLLEGKIMASVFYEESTRTRLSFEAAMYKLGGNVITTENAKQFSSAAKGESLEHTVRVIGCYSDVIVLRYFEQGSAERAVAVSEVPIINAGDGPGEHPTQALLDAYTLKKEFGRIDGLKIAMVGDLKYGRTIHSLSQLLTLYKNIELFLVSPPQLRLQEEYKTYLIKKNLKFREVVDLDYVLERVDAVYMTRIQKKRFSSKQAFQELKGYYRLTNEKVDKMHKNARVLHPLPIDSEDPETAEIAAEVDNNSRAAYFRQAKNGLYIRMALLQMILG